LFSAAGTYTVLLTAVASCGVFTSTYVASIIRCSSNCQASISFRDSCAGSVSSFRIEANSPINAVSWNFGDPASGVSDTSGFTITTHKFSIPGTYRVRAVANLACSTLIVTRDVTILNCINEPEGCSGILPSGFTPNADGQNDFFYVRSEDIKTIKSLRVYNRWGQLLFEKEGGAPNDESFGWDGKFQGEVCGPDIYMWYVEGICASGKIVILKGDIMIIR
jgi:gliding motility-associated-like protein